jgi:hypothetical protein
VPHDARRRLVETRDVPQQGLMRPPQILSINVSHLVPL